MNFLVRLLRNMGINSAIAEAIGGKLIGASGLLTHGNAGGRMPTDRIDGYTFNEADGRWYGYPPRPDVGVFGWNSPAPDWKQSELSQRRYFAELNNSLERPVSDEKDLYSPSFLDLIKKFPEIFERYKEIWPDIWKEFKDALPGSPHESVPADILPRIDLAVPFEWAIPGGIGSDINMCYRTAKEWRPWIDPLMLDLDGDGLELMAADGGVLFDHDGDSIKVGTGWIGADDGILVRDVNGDGEITSGAELFGVDTVKRDGSKAADGFDALGELDSNHDGNFTSADSAWGDVKVWRDLNQNGRSDAGELFTLDQLGISRIGLGGSATNTTGGQQAGSFINGNFVAQSATFTQTRDGVTTERTVGAIDLQANAFYREFTQISSTAASASGLPDMHGSGRALDLQQAVAQSPALAASLDAFSQAGTREAQLALVDQLITEWAKSSDFWSSIEANLRGAEAVDVSITPPDGMTIEQFRNLIGVLEVFNGERFYTLPPNGASGAAASRSLVAGVNWTGSSGDGAGAATYAISPPAAQMELLQLSYDALLQGVYGALAVQTRLKPYLESVDVRIDEDGVSFDTSALAAMLEAAKTSNPEQALADLVDLSRHAYSGLSAVGFDVSGTLRLWVESASADPATLATLNALDVLTSTATTGTSRSDVYLGSDTENFFDGRLGDDVLDGGGGNDTLMGAWGNDTLIGGAGDDKLHGGSGSDTYVVNQGEGADTILELSAMPGHVDVDVVQFNGIDSTDVTAVERRNTDLVLRYGGADQLTVADYFSSPHLRVEQMRFADGVTWDDAALASRVVFNGTSGVDHMYGSADVANRMYGMEGNDDLTGGDLDDVMDGGSGADLLSGAAGNDLLAGGAGVDTLSGGAGDDTLQGGEGSDRLDGGAGSDMLVGGIGDDTLSGGEGDDTYVFNLGDGADTISSYEVTAGRLDVVRFNDVASTAITAVERQGNDLVMRYGSADQVTVSGYYSAPGYRIDQVRFADGVTWDQAALARSAVFNGTSGADYMPGARDQANDMRGLDGNDYMFGGDEGDVMDGGRGADFMLAGAGDDAMAGGLDDDILRGGTGSDMLAGEAGNDMLEGEEGRDTLIGGIGQDTLKGGAGDDTYVFALGDGVDTIAEDDRTAGNVDVVQFNGVASTDVSAVERNGWDLVLRYGAADQLTVSNYYAYWTSAYRVEQLRFADGVTWDQAALAGRAVYSGTSGTDQMYGSHDEANTMYGLDGNDALWGGSQGDMMDGGSGADSLTGQAGNDVLIGGSGADTLRGGLGDDTLTGGDANDILDGAEGSDTYVFNRGDGFDTIRDIDTTPGMTEVDVVQLNGIASTDVVAVERNSNDLMIRYGTTDIVTVASYFDSPHFRIEQVRFADGVTWDQATLTGLAIYNGTSGADRLYGANDAADRLYGLDGDDYLWSGGQNDVLEGDSGADTLSGGAGDDTLAGGVGNDMLEGGEGSDTYVFHRDDGADAIFDNDSTAGNQDLLRFGEGIGADQLWFSRSGSDLVVNVIGTSDKVTLQNWFFGADYQIEHLVSGDGHALANTDVDALVQAMASFAPPAAGQTSLPPAYQNDLAPALAAAWR